MTRWAIILFVTCALVPSDAIPSGALAQSADNDTDQRFVFHEVDEGILRLDSKLGGISHCSRQGVGWTCRMVPDERAAIDAEMARLQQENAELKSAMRPNGTVAGRPDLAARSAQTAKPAEPAKTSDGDLKHVRHVVGLIWHRLVEMMAQLRADLSKTT